MQKFYIQVDESYVLPDPGDLSELALDGCLVGRHQGTLFIHPLERLSGKQVETDSSHTFFGFSKEEGELFRIENGKRVNGTFCNICCDKLNGITGNCFSYRVKPKGCEYQPMGPSPAFRISLGERKKIRATLVNKYTAFRKPCGPSQVDFSPGTIRRNKRLQWVSRHYVELREKKEEKYCSRCIFNGLCYYSTQRVARHCMVSEQRMMAQSLESVKKRFGNVDEFLKKLSYGSGMIRYRPRGGKRKTKWYVSMPLGRKRFLIRKLGRRFTTAKVSRTRIERLFQPVTLPAGNREKAAALAWYFLRKFLVRGSVWGYRGTVIRPFWIHPDGNGIRATLYRCGSSLRLDGITFTTINGMNRFFSVSPYY